MKIQIDTNKKTIQVIENANLGELIKALKSMLGEDYKEYLLIQEQISYTYYPSSSPVIIPYVPYNPYGYPTITYNSGVYNIELQ